MEGPPALARLCAGLRAPIRARIAVHAINICSPQALNKVVPKLAAKYGEDENTLLEVARGVLQGSRCDGCRPASCFGQPVGFPGASGVATRLHPPPPPTCSRLLAPPSLACSRFQMDGEYVQLKQDPAAPTQPAAPAPAAAPPAPAPAVATTANEADEAAAPDEQQQPGQGEAAAGEEEGEGEQPGAGAQEGQQARPRKNVKRRRVDPQAGAADGGEGALRAPGSLGVSCRAAALLRDGGMRLTALPASCSTLSCRHL